VLIVYVLLCNDSCVLEIETMVFDISFKMERKNSLHPDNATWKSSY